jgi:hypothetical protein
MNKRLETDDLQKLVLIWTHFLERVAIMKSLNPIGFTRFSRHLTVLTGLLAACCTLFSSPATAQLGFASTVGGNLYSIDFSTGSTTLIGNTGVNLLEGLALAPNGSLFGTNDTGNLYSINPNTAVSTLIGSTGRGNIEGLDFNNNTLLGITFENQPTVFSINTANASTTNVVTATSATGVVRALTVQDPNNVLIRTENPTPETLQSLSLTTGATTVLGTITSRDLVTGLDFASDGNLYGVDLSGLILRINPNNAATTIVASSGLHFLDLTASFTAVPEPGTAAMLAGLSLTGLTFVLRRRHARRK